MQARPISKRASRPLTSQLDLDAAPSSVAALADLVRDRAWTFLSAASSPSDIVPVTEDLFHLPRGDLRRLAAVHVAVSPEAGEMLVSAARILRELPSSIVRARVETRGAMRPPVIWRDTYARRLQTRDYSVFVSAPTERRYDAPLARLVKLSLNQSVYTSELADLHAARGIGDLIAVRRAAASRLLHHAKLREVRSVRALPIHALRGALRHRHTEPIVAFVDHFRDAVEEQSPRVSERL